MTAGEAQTGVHWKRGINETGEDSNGVAARTHVHNDKVKQKSSYTDLKEVPHSSQEREMQHSG